MIQGASKCAGCNKLFITESTIKTWKGRYCINCYSKYRLKAGRHFAGKGRHIPLKKKDALRYKFKN